ncbi:hypothetical protein AMECASPLE_022495 [Ameca splendens]|uniref:Uncharacterized protein n=1 Tax=Ameca splendens TaxID=208324 RepID=A0ABV0YF77_9TELE
MLDSGFVIKCVKNRLRQSRLPVLPSFASANDFMMPVSDRCSLTFKILLQSQMLPSLLISVSSRGSSFPAASAAPLVICILKQKEQHGKHKAQILLEQMNI